MTREEEIKQAALNYAEKIDYDLWLDTEHPKSYAKMLVMATAEDNAKWADQHPIQQRTFTMEELKQFVHDHIQSKIEHNELPLVGFDMNNVENFEREFDIFENTLLEGIINGISLCEGKVEGIEW